VSLPGVAQNNKIVFPHLIKHDRTVDHLRRVVDDQNLSQFEGFSVVHDSGSQDEDGVQVAHHHEKCGEGARHQRPAACPGICKFQSKMSKNLRI
jgi:hypothetical protein